MIFEDIFIIVNYITNLCNIKDNEEEEEQFYDSE